MVKSSSNNNSVAYFPSWSQPALYKYNADHKCKSHVI